MKSTIYGLIFLFLVSSAHAVELKVLSTPGAQRNQLQNDYEQQLNSGTIGTESLSELGIIYHMQINENGLNHETVIKAHEILTKAYEMEKGNPLTMVYLGSVTTMMATTIDGGMAKMKFVKKGTRLMDRAVKKHPNDVNLRMVRGGNSLGLPTFLQRSRYAVEDFSHVLGLIEGAPSPFKAQIHFSLGNAYELTEQPEQAKAQWQQVIQLVPQSKLAKRAQAKL